MFSYLYYNSYVGAEVGVSVGSVLSSAVQLSRKEQLELWGLLANLLAGTLRSRRPSRCRWPQAVTCYMALPAMQFNHFWTGTSNVVLACSSTQNASGY